MKFQRKGTIFVDRHVNSCYYPCYSKNTYNWLIYSSNRPSAKPALIITITACAFADDVREAMESGIDAHIAKPVQSGNLQAAIQKVLDNRLKQIVGERDQSNSNLLNTLRIKTGDGTDA